MAQVKVEKGQLVSAKCSMFEYYTPKWEEKRNGPVQADDTKTVECEGLYMIVKECNYELQQYYATIQDKGYDEDYSHVLHEAHRGKSWWVVEGYRKPTGRPPTSTSPLGGKTPCTWNGYQWTNADGTLNHKYDYIRHFDVPSCKIVEAKTQVGASTKDPSGHEAKKQKVKNRGEDEDEEEVEDEAQAEAQDEEEEEEAESQAEAQDEAQDEEDDDEKDDSARFPKREREFYEAVFDARQELWAAIEKLEGVWPVGTK